VITWSFGLLTIRFASLLEQRARIGDTDGG
jgi:hypothetical protein